MPNVGASVLTIARPPPGSWNLGSQCIGPLGIQANWDIARSAALVVDELSRLPDFGGTEAPDTQVGFTVEPADIETRRSQGDRLHLRRFGLELRCF
jgi:hypothetical protein